MTHTTASGQGSAASALLASTAPLGLAAGGKVEASDLTFNGEVEIAGRRYITPERLAALLDVSVRTLNRWHAMRIGPPRVKVGRLVLFDLAKLPEWLRSRETEPVRGAARRAT
jgi:hypothetical protein